METAFLVEHETLAESGSLSSSWACTVLSQPEMRAEFMHRIWGSLPTRHSPPMVSRCWGFSISVFSSVIQYDCKFSPAPACSTLGHVLRAKDTNKLLSLFQINIPIPSVSACFSYPPEPFRQLLIISGLKFFFFFFFNSLREFFLFNNLRGCWSHRSY